MAAKSNMAAKFNFHKVFHITLIIIVIYNILIQSKPIDNSIKT
jgi:hypothetical protein